FQLFRVAVLRRRECVGYSDEVSQTVIDRFALVHRDAAHDVRMVAYDRVGTRVACSMRDLVLVVLDACWSMTVTLVEGDDDDVHVMGQSGDGIRQTTQRRAVGERVDLWRVAGVEVIEVVVGEHLDEGCTGLLAGGP